MIKNRLFGLVVMLGVLMGFANLGFAEPQLNINDLSTDGQILELDNDVDLVVQLDGCDTNELAEATYTILTSGMVEDGNSQTLQCYDSNCTERILISDFMFGDEITVAFDANSQLGILSLVNNEEIDINGITIPSGTKIYDLTFFYTSEQNDITVFGFNYDMLNYTEPEVQQEVELKSIELGGGEMMFMMESLEGDNVPEYPVWPDLNTDNIINFLDFARFAENWQKTGAGLEGDFDNDDDVDVADLIQIAYFWLETENPSDFPYITSFEESQGFTQSMDMNDVSNWVITGQGQALVAQASFTEDSNSFSYNYVAVDSNTILSKFFTITTALNNTYLRISCIPTDSSYIRILDRSNVVAALRFGDPCDANDPNMYIYDNGSFTDTGFNYRTAVQTCRSNLAAQNSYEDCWMEFKFNFDWQNSSYSINYGSSDFDANFTDTFLAFNEIQFETGITDSNTFNINRISISDETTAGGIFGDGNDIWISSPQADWTVSLEGHVAIYGSAWYDRMTRYEIKCCPTDLDPCDLDNWMPVCTGDKIVKDGILGYFDTYKFRNSDYFLKIELYNDVNQIFSSDIITKTITYNNLQPTVNSRYPVTGISKPQSFHREENADITINWPGSFQFDLRRTYDHSLRRYPYPLFFGWTHNHNIRLMESTETDWLTDSNDNPVADANGLGIGRLYLLMPVGGRTFSGQIESGEVVYRPLDDGQDYIVRTSSIHDGDQFDVSYTHYAQDGITMQFVKSDNELSYTPSDGKGAVAWTAYMGIDRKEDRFGNALSYTWQTVNNIDLLTEISNNRTSAKLVFNNNLSSLGIDNMCGSIAIDSNDEQGFPQSENFITFSISLNFGINYSASRVGGAMVTCAYEIDLLPDSIMQSDPPSSHNFIVPITYLKYNQDEILVEKTETFCSPMSYPSIYDEKAYTQLFSYTNEPDGTLRTKTEYQQFTAASDWEPVIYRITEVLHDAKGLTLKSKTETSAQESFDPSNYSCISPWTDYWGNLMPNINHKGIEGGGGYVDIDYSYGDSRFPAQPTEITEHFDNDGDGEYDTPDRKTVNIYDDRGNLSELRSYISEDEFVRKEYDYHQFYNFPIRQTTWQGYSTSSTDTGKKVCREWLYGDDPAGSPSTNGDLGKFLIKERTLVSEQPDVWAQTTYAYDSIGRTIKKMVKKSEDQNNISCYEYDNGFLSKEWQGVTSFDSNGTPEQEPTKKYYFDEKGCLRLEGDYLGLVKMYCYNAAGQMLENRKYTMQTGEFEPATYDNNYLSITAYGEYDYYNNAGLEYLPTGADVEKFYCLGKFRGNFHLFLNDGIPYSEGPAYYAGYTCTGDGRLISAEYGEDGWNYIYYLYFYDSMDRLTNTYGWEVDPERNNFLKEHRQVGYYASGQKSFEKVYSVDPNFNRKLEKYTVYNYDLLDRMIYQIEDACDVQENPGGLNITVQYGYDAVGNRTYIVDPDGNYIFTDYDNANRKICEYFACQPVYFYGIVDFVSTKVSAIKKKEYQYYLDGQIKDVNSYNSDGETLLERSEYTYDGRSRIKTVTQQVDSSIDANTVYDYNDVGFTRANDPNKYQIRITDAESKQTWISLNLEGKPQKIVYPSGDYEKTIYDGNGIAIQKSVWDSNGIEQTIFYEYDTLGNRNKIVYPDNGYLSYEYSGRILGQYGKITKITDNRNNADRLGDSNSTFEYEYDFISGNIKKYTDYDGITVEYEYDRAYPDCKKSIVVKNSSQSEIYNVSYLYDLSGRLLDVNDNLSTAGYENIAGFGYDNNGNRSQLKYWLSGVENDYDTAMVIAYSYDTENNLASIGASRSYYDPNFGLVFYYDPNFAFDANSGDGIDGLGRLFDANEIITVAGQNRMWNLDFTYDMLSQLTSAQLNRPDTNGIDWSLAYQYSKDGNIDQKTINGGQPTVYGYYGDLMTDIGNDQLDWDENGRLIFTPTIDFEYNWDGKLRNATIGSDSIALKYDPMGNRVIKNSTINGNRKYIVDIAGGLPVVLCEINDSNGSLTNSYFYADGQVLTQVDSNGSYFFYIHDRLGSIRQLVDDSGSVVNSYAYNPFGEDLANDCNETIYNPFKYTGQWFDSEIGQYYLRARMYDPALGRFTSRDPVFGKNREPLTLHKYLYCVNNPINRVDLTGEFSASTLVAPTMAGVATYALGISVLAYGVSQNSNDYMSLGIAITQGVGQVMSLVGVGMGFQTAIVYSVKNQFPKEYPYNDKNNIDRLLNEHGQRQQNEIPPDDFWKKVLFYVGKFLEQFHND